MPLPSTLRLVPDLNMCPRHLPDLADLAALASDHTANQLEGRQDLTLSKGLDPWIPLPHPPQSPSFCSHHWEPETPASWSVCWDPVLRQGRRTECGLRALRASPSTARDARLLAAFLPLKLLTWHHTG